MIIFNYLCQEMGEDVVKEALKEVFSTIELPRNPNVEKSKVPRLVKSVLCCISKSFLQSKL